MSELQNIFKKNKDEYKITLTPIKDYIEMSSDFVSTMKDIDKETAIKDVKKYIKDNEAFHNPKVYFYERDLDGKRSKKIDTLSSYMTYVTDNNKIIVPSFTLYFNPKEKVSLHAEFTEENIKKRSMFKKEAFKQKLQDNMDLFNYNNTLQKSMKIYNNSLSGAYASGGTILNNPSAHYTLTSITRCLSGIGNAISESVIAGNRHYKDPDVTLNHVVTIANDADEDKIKEVILKFNIKIPTVEEVMDAILKSSSKYWRDINKERVIYGYLEKLSGFKRAYIMYHNDMYHFRKLNDDFMRNMINDMLDYTIIDGDEDSFDYIIKNSEDWVYNFVIHILSERLIGKSKDDYTIDDKQHIASIVFNLNKQFLKYKDIFKTFLVTNIFPVSIGTIKEMVREAIVLSDTDSTCATYQEWVHWYFDGPNYSSKSIGVTAAIMTIVTMTVDHYIKLFGANMNIDYKAANILEMKNEFFWKVFVNTNVSKHYFASIFIQEGNIYKADPKEALERKGVHLIAPNAYGPIRDLAEELMVTSMETVYNNEKIVLNDYLNKVLEAEKLIMDKLKQGSPDVLKLEKIKEAKTYKLSPTDSPFIHHILWEEVFADEYGHAPDPTYMAIKFPTTITNKNQMLSFIDNIENKEFAEKFRNFILKYDKVIKTFRLPLITIYNNKLPDEILPVIDANRVVKDNCKVLYIILESLGYHIKNDMTLTEYLL